MASTDTSKILIRILVFASLCLTLWVLTGRTQNVQQEESYISINIIKQLEPENQTIPAEIRCGMAHLTAPNRLEGFDCIIRNNTNKKITAVNAIYSVLIEEDGVLSKDTHSSTIDTVIHPDFKKINKAILPGEERPLGPPGAISYPNAIIKEVEIGIDYVEFDDTTTRGADEKGSQIIKDIREGAAKYKTWLSQKFNQQKRSVSAIVPLLQKEEPLPAVLQFINQQQELGAKAYRNYLRTHLARTGSAFD